VTSFAFVQIRYDVLSGSAEGAVHPKFTDVNYTLKFGRQKVLRSFLVLGVLCLIIGIVGTSYGGLRGTDKYIPYVAFAVGLALTGYAMHGTFNKTTPIAVLSPSGIVLDIEWVKNFLIPWHEVKAVEKIDISVPTKGWYRTYKDVTAVVVSKTFYDRTIHVSNPLLRGPGWEHNFIDNGDTVQVALNHAVLPATAEEIYAAVDSRWKAFRDKTNPKAKTP
jgi:hypothetical protein